MPAGIREGGVSIVRGKYEGMTHRLVAHAIEDRSFQSVVGIVRLSMGRQCYEQPKARPSEVSLHSL